MRRLCWRGTCVCKLSLSGFEKGLACSRAEDLNRDDLNRLQVGPGAEFHQEG